jgi:hypothetical protein
VARVLASRYPLLVSTPPPPQPSADDEPVPKLPRGRGIRLSKPEMFRIALTLITLIGVIVLMRPCANAVSGFVTSFDNGSNQTMPKPGNVDVSPPEPQYEQLRPGMTEAEIKAAMERSKARAAGSAGAGSAKGGSDAPAGSSAGAK